MAKHLSNIIFVIVIFIIGTLAYFAYDNNKVEIQNKVEYKPANTPKNVNAQEPKLTTVGSPDGKMSLAMKEEGDDSVLYTFLLKDEGTGLVKQIFTKTASVGATLTIPFNTFSPDNKYVFLKETYGGKNSYILPLNGEEINFSDLFANKYEDFLITDVTGWGGINLIVINTDKVDGGVGPSFWFDVTSKSFIRLSNRFN
jgi:hypothetical protein